MTLHGGHALPTLTHEQRVDVQLAQVLADNATRSPIRTTVAATASKRGASTKAKLGEEQSIR